MPYTPINWQNEPSTATPLSAANLNAMDTAIEFAYEIAEKFNLADPNADRILFWDDSAGAYAFLTASTGLEISGTSMTVRSASETQTGIVELATTAEAVTGTDTARAVTPAGVTAALQGATNAEFIRDTMGTALVAGSNVTITPNDGANTITIDASGAGGFSFADPNADRIGFWDDSAGSFQPLTHSAPLTISGTTLSISSASDTASGIVELATTAETTTGTDTTRAVTPAGVAAAIAGKAPLASPAFTGNPTAPTPATADNDTSIATTAFVKAQNYVEQSLANAKGDILVALSDNTFDTVNLGTNGQVLTVDSSIGVGVKWASPSGGGGTVIGLTPKTSGHYLHPPLRGGNNGSIASAAAGAVFGTPIIIPNSGFTVDAVAIRVTTTEASCLAGVYLYSVDSDGHPVTRVIAGEGIDCSGSGARSVTLGAPVSLSAGLHWAFVRTNSPGGTVRFYCVSPGIDFGSVSSSLLAAGGTPWGLQADIGVYGSTNSTLSAWSYNDPGGSTVQPLVMLRRS